MRARHRSRLLIGGSAILVLSACPKPPEPGDPLDRLSDEEMASFERGRAVFDSLFTPETGLGPLFNADGCAACHSVPVSGGAGPISEIHATVFTADGFCDPLADRGGPVFQQRFTPALEDAVGFGREPIPEGADTTLRTTPDMLGFGLLDAVPDSTLLALADPDDADGDGISGRVNRFFDGRIGRFGRKALVPTLDEFNEGAFQIEQGVTTPNVPTEGTVGGQPIPDGVDPLPEPELSAEALGAVNAFVRLLAPPSPRKLSGRAKHGREVFSQIGCAACHIPTLRTGDHEVAALANKEVHAYTDLLVHDMGAGLSDVCLGRVALREEFRTEPLMGLRHMARFLHDGRATTVEGAIEAHDGEGAASRAAYTNLSDTDREALLEFLRSL